MSRPRSVRYKTIHLYDKLHSQIVKMHSGAEITALYLMKETEKFFMSSQVWAYCCSATKVKKPATLKVEIPVITDERTISFLDEHKWADWLEKELAEKDSETIEAIAYLERACPGKKPVFFYELDSVIALHIQGFLKKYYGEPNGRNLEHLKYYNAKYNKFSKIPEIAAMRKRWTDEKDKELSDKYLREYMDFERDYSFEHNNLTDIFQEIGNKAVCFPVAFSKGTADWSIKKYGKEIGYGQAGEIFFVTTPEHVYFYPKRHF